MMRDEPEYVGSDVSYNPTVEVRRAVPVQSDDPTVPAGTSFVAMAFEKGGHTLTFAVPVEGARHIAGLLLELSDRIERGHPGGD